ncbi:tyrosine-type recombinase/integrase [Streptococcus agalactiae]|uniref:tyrosine-type recombinase/integrase n=1 Tax=Streptococcus agalactiae TaxID=1311 RepID=UPI002553A476|nr:tyrosine-type recombinase/integrase [Streptococcus agalactiae]MDK8747550.1 tyrosine-type recombinase/integrase [Streptococcus agalactiae]
MAPIKDQEKIDLFKEELKNTNKSVYILVYVSLYTGLRLEDILVLKNGQVRDTHIRIKEKKTNKSQRIVINPNLSAVFPNGEEDDYLIKDKINPDNPMDKTVVLKILQKAADKVGINGFSEDTLRQTFGYHLYQSFQNHPAETPVFYDKEQQIKLMQDVLGLNSTEETKEYIGIVEYPFMRKRFGVD